MKNKIMLAMAILLAILSVSLIGMINYSSNQRKSLKTAKNNTTALLQQMKIDSADHANTVTALTLKANEYLSFRTWANSEIERLGLKNKNLQEMVSVITETNVRYQALLKDSIKTIIRKDTILLDTMKCFNYSTPYFHSWGCIKGDTLKDAGVYSIDSIFWVKHVIPKQFLFIKYGIKRIDVTFTNKNLNSKLNYFETVQIK